MSSQQEGGRVGPGVWSLPGCDPPVSLTCVSVSLSPSVMVEPLSSVSPQNDLESCDLVSLRSLVVDPGMRVRHRARQKHWRHVYWIGTFSKAPELWSLFFFLLLHS